MRKIKLMGSLFAVLCAAFSVFATDDVPQFSYGVTLTKRFETNSVTVASLDQPALVDGQTPATDNLATVFMVNTPIQAIDVEDWEFSTNQIGSAVQAAFTLLDDGGTLKWIGFAGGQWVDLTGFTPADGTYDVKIDFDYSLSVGSSNPARIRYSIRASGSDDAYTELTHGSETWVVIGTSKSSIERVSLYGFVTTGAVGAESGIRPVAGQIDALVEDVGLNYETLKLSVKPSSSAWGVDMVKVVLTDSHGQAQEAQKAIASAEQGFVVLDLSSLVKPGESYTYDVKLAGDAGETPAERRSVALYSSDAWFYFNKSDAFVRATDENITIADGKFSATDEDVEGTVTPDEEAGANVGIVVTTEVEISGVNADLEDYESDAPQFAVALGGTADAPVWKYCEGGVWKDSANTQIPTTNGLYEGRATFDYAAKTVRYEIRPKDAVSGFQVLVDAALPNDKTELAAVAIKGGGNVSALEARRKLAQPPAVEPAADGSILLDGNATVDLSRLDAGGHAVTCVDGKKAHLSWTDSDGKYAVMSGNTLTVKAGETMNGVASSFDSYVLGLDAETETSRPAAVVVSNLSQDEKGIVVSVPNLVNVRADLGYAVKLRLEESTDGGKTWNPTGGDVDVDAQLTVPLFDSENSGKLYRVNTVIK